MRDYKTNKHHVPLIIFLQACPNSLYCPVKALYEYIALYKHTDGPLFQTMDGSPITYAAVSSHLKAAIQFIGLSPDQFKGHSFRIGAATHAASLGFSDNVIQKLGRWNSDAFKHYIRIKSFKL
jgi:integrase